MNYCEAIFNRYKDKVKYWLTFNEINSATMPMGGYLSQGILNEGTTDFTNQVDIPQLRFQGLHHQFVASAKAVKLAHEIDPNYQLDVWLYMQLYILILVIQMIYVLAQQKSRVMNYFCADVQVRGEYPTYMNRYFKENNIEIKMEDKDLEILKEGCVDFYTFSYYMSICASSDPER